MNKNLRWLIYNNKIKWKIIYLEMNTNSDLSSIKVCKKSNTPVGHREDHC